ncbi:murein hydrolase activator EnvC family protein [Bowmanella yangjiangensis]|uniref:Peptidoglycan DD-metalloendopeptidase family protein n=1 Tax=Bowmanella yangjiangensis TaxID=2811230 RepID=A0ABS3CT44_9ALTE|nr:peptidoglycan DD-metalloendopeptidase family protein [Bowmanella yangjiangensis]MBN7819596.1 peptidoglycan DD-metalloendopeptidase family protein [Bowmanella yangjiangensis]
MKFTRPLLWPCLFCLLAWPVLAQDDTDQQLKALQEQIKQRQQQLDLRLSDAKELEASLQKAEKDIAGLVKDIKRTRTRLDANNAEQDKLKKEAGQLQSKIRQQQDALGAQLRSAYMTGQHDFTKMLLNQEDAAKLERMLSYYGYLNKARLAQIREFTEMVKRLEVVRLELVGKQTELVKLEQVQEAQRQLMASEQKKRERTLSELAKRIDTEAAQIEQLQINEQNLIQAIQRAAELAARQNQTLAGLDNMKGKLLRPAQGRLRDLFGKRRQGQVHWKGVLFQGNTGDAVRAVHHGKVLFADWLRGFGLVTVIDHGDGYMSLYGYNQALLKGVGESVEAGEEVALLGQTGGQTSPALYFELRHKGQAISPAGWLEKP